MDIRTRLFRRPITTVLWTVLLIAMALLVGVGSVLSYSTQNLLPMLGENHTAIALRTDRASESIDTDKGVIWTMESKFFTQEDYDYFMSLDSVQDIYFHSLTGGYVPELMPVLALSDTYGNISESYDNANESYDQVVVVGTILRIWGESEPIPRDLSPIGLGKQEPCKTIYAEVYIDEIVSAHPDYPFSGTEMYTGVVNCSFTLCGEDAINYVEPGKQYLISGEYDPWVFSRSDWPQESYHPSLYVGYETVVQNGSLWGYRYGFSYISNSIQNLVSWPAVARIDGNVDEYLSNPDNADWMKYIDHLDCAQHSMPIIGTDNLESMYLFHSGDAAIVDGRKFAEDEYNTGAKVCLISETVANRSGVKVGDTIHLSQFLCNEAYNMSISSASPDGMLNNPTVGEPFSDLAYKTENEEFEIVGIYRQTNEWEQTSYCVTPSTIFIPKKAQIAGGFGDFSTTAQETFIDKDGNEHSGTMVYEHGSYGVFFSILLHNGYMADFNLAVSGTEWENQFHTFDQGYEGVINSMNGAAKSAQTLFLFAVSGWVMILALYVVLYQSGQRKNLGIMRSLGAKPKQARRYLFGGGFTLAAVCVVAGTCLTVLLTNLINSKLLDLMMAEVTMEQHSGGMEMGQDALTQMIAQSQLPNYVLVLSACIQLIVIAVALWIHAGMLAKKAPRKLMGV